MYTVLGIPIIPMYKKIIEKVMIIKIMIFLLIIKMCC